MVYPQKPVNSPQLGVKPALSTHSTHDGDNVDGGGGSELSSIVI